MAARSGSFRTTCTSERVDAAVALPPKEIAPEAVAGAERAAERAAGSRVAAREHAEFDRVRRPALAVPAVRPAHPCRQDWRTSAEAPAAEPGVECAARRRLQRDWADRHLHVDATLA